MPGCRSCEGAAGTCDGPDRLALGARIRTRTARRQLAEAAPRVRPEGSKRVATVESPAQGPQLVGGRVAWLDSSSRCIGECRDVASDFTEATRYSLRVSRPRRRPRVLYTSKSSSGTLGGTADTFGGGFEFALSRAFLATETTKEFEGREYSSFGLRLTAGPRPRSREGRSWRGWPGAPRRASRARAPGSSCRARCWSTTTRPAAGARRIASACGISRPGAPARRCFPALSPSRTSRRRGASWPSRSTPTTGRPARPRTAQPCVGPRPPTALRQVPGVHPHRQGAGRARRRADEVRVWMSTRLRGLLRAGGWPLRDRVGVIRAGARAIHRQRPPHPLWTARARAPRRPSSGQAEAHGG